VDNKEFLIAQGYNRLDVEIAIGGYEEIPQLDPDLMFVKFIMCHEGINANGDTFTKEVLKQAQSTPKYKPIDWEHGQPMIGHILDSQYKEDSQGIGYIEATGLIWKFVYPELSSQIKEKASTGELRLSMECYYKDANYKVGDQLFDQQQAEKMGIIPYVGREYMGKKVARVFKEVIFGGVGVVANPADKQAVFLAVAKDLGLNKEEAIKRVVNDFTNKQHSIESHNALAVAKFVKAFDRAKSSVVAKFNNKTLRSKEQVVAEVRNSIQTLLLEVASISDSYYRGIANKDVVETDEDEGLQLFELMQQAVETNTASNSELSEAYLVAVQEDYIIYDIIDYSTDSVITMQASYVINNGEVEIDFPNAVQFAKKEDIESMAKKEETVAASELEAAATTDKDLNDMLGDEKLTDVNTPKASKNDGDPEDDKDGGKDEDTEDKNGKPKKEKASEYEETIANLEARLAEAQAQIAQFEARFAEMEAEKTVASRLAELKDAGIVFSGSRLEKEQAKLRSMTNEAFADYKDLLLEVAGKKDKDLEEYEHKVLEADELSKQKDNRDAIFTEAEKQEADDDDEEEAAKASVEEEIVIEGARASTLNLETPPVTNRRPFGHLSRGV
jgi:hypothetical protein